MKDNKLYTYFILEFSFFGKPCSNEYLRVSCQKHADDLVEIPYQKVFEKQKNLRVIYGTNNVGYL